MLGTKTSTNWNTVNKDSFIFSDGRICFLVNLLYRLLCQCRQCRLEDLLLQRSQPSFGFGWSPSHQNMQRTILWWFATNTNPSPASNQLIQRLSLTRPYLFPHHCSTWERGFSINPTTFSFHNDENVVTVPVWSLKSKLNLPCTDKKDTAIIFPQPVPAKLQK